MSLRSPPKLSSALRAPFLIRESESFRSAGRCAGPGDSRRHGTYAQASRGPQPNDSAQRFAKLAWMCSGGGTLWPVRIRSRCRTNAAVQTGRHLRPGARATDPPIPGLAETGYLTTETVLEVPRAANSQPIGADR